MLALLLALTLSLGNDELNPTSADTLARPVGLMARGLTSFGAEILDGHLYVFGGYFGKPHAYSSAGQSDVFERIDLGDTTHIERVDGGVAMQGAALVAANGTLIRVGGMVAENAQGEKARLRSVADVRAFDPRSNTWTKLSDLPDARSSHDVELVGRHLIVVGGWTLSPGEMGRFADSALVLDLDSTAKGWKSFSTRTPRRALATARLGDRVAVIGGLDADGEVMAKVEYFDPVRGTWDDGPDFPGSAFGVAACAVADHVLASGKDGAVWRLETGATQWKRVGALAFPRFFHQMVADEHGGAWIIGGIDEMRADGRVRHIERFDEKPSAPAVETFEIDAPFRARNRMGLFVHGDRVLFFGGNRSLKQHDFGADDFLDGCDELDLATLAWTKHDPLPVRRQSMSAIVVDGHSVAIGGFGTTYDRATAQKSALRWSFADKRWSQDSTYDLPAPRTQFALVENRGALFAFGGLDYDTARGDDAFVHPTNVLRFDTSDSSRGWRDAGFALARPRRAFACAVLADKAYLVGGMREEFELVEDCEAIDLATGTTTKIASPKSARTSASLVALGNDLYLCGGSSQRDGDRLEPDTSIEVYDRDRDAWRTLVEALPVEMRHMQAFALRGRLVLVSSHVEGDTKLRVVIVTP